VEVITSQQPGLLFDYYGFPDHTYKLTYGAQGSPFLAMRVKEALEQGGIPCRENTKRDWDHGVFIPMKLAYPEGDVPIVQVRRKGNI